MMRPIAIGLCIALAACNARPDGTQDAAAPVAQAPASSAAPTAPDAKPSDAAAAVKGVVCSTDEQTLFSCEFENGKRVAVCGAGEWLGHYRYGSEESELELSGGKLANVMYSGGGESQIAFENGDYRYIVFSRIVRTNFKAGEPNDPAISDGLLVLRGEERVSMHLCKADALKPVDINAANAIWEVEPDLFTGETINADPEWARE